MKMFVYYFVVCFSILSCSGDFVEIDKVKLLNGLYVGIKDEKPFTGTVRKVAVGYVSGQLEMVLKKGRVIKTTTHNKEGHKQQERVYSDDLSKTNSFPIRVTAYYPDGKKSKEMIYNEKGNKTSKASWYRNGQKRYIANYENGSPTGGKRWDEKGNLYKTNGTVPFVKTNLKKLSTELFGVKLGADVKDVLAEIKKQNIFYYKPKNVEKVLGSFSLSVGLDESSDAMSVRVSFVEDKIFRIQVDTRNDGFIKHVQKLLAKENVKSIAAKDPFTAYVLSSNTVLEIFVRDADKSGIKQGIISIYDTKLSPKK